MFLRSYPPDAREDIRRTKLGSSGVPGVSLTLSDITAGNPGMGRWASIHSKCSKV